MISHETDQHRDQINFKNFSYFENPTIISDPLLSRQSTKLPFLQSVTPRIFPQRRRCTSTSTSTSPSAQLNAASIAEAFQYSVKVNLAAQRAALHPEPTH